MRSNACPHRGSECPAGVEVEAGHEPAFKGWLRRRVPRQSVCQLPIGKHLSAHDQEGRASKG